MININRLRSFLVKAKKSTSFGDDASKKTINKDQSTTIDFVQDDWKYHDNYFGGEPYGGREVVFCKEKPIYMMTYYGEVFKTASSLDNVYGILMKALKLVSIETPFRGPAVLEEGELLYENQTIGDIKSFHGEETIKEGGKVVYRARYAGGLVDVKKG